MRHVVLMGVSGSGKSSLGAALAARLGWTFIEADALHSVENVAKMRRGVALTDADRAPWLDAVGARIVAAEHVERSSVTCCSALKRAYRDRLRLKAPSIHFVFLEIAPDDARVRVSARSDHYMPASLVDAQFATLEPPGDDELLARLNACAPLTENLETLCAALAISPRT